MQDTYYVQAHWRFSAPILAVFAAFALFYFLVTRLSKRRPHRVLAGLHFWVFALGGALLLSPQVWLSAQGMPRRYVDAPTVQFEYWSWVSGAGYVLAAIGLVAFIAVMGEMILRRPSPDRQ